MDIVNLLLDQKLDVNVYDKLGKTPLFYSMFQPQLKITKLLVKAGALTWFKNIEGI
jgi:ankyrin repeat protein